MTAFTSGRHVLRMTGASTASWRPSIDRVHRVLTTTVLGGIAVLALVWLQGGGAISAWGAPALLVGGALIGIPHGSSDFVVAHRVLRRRLGHAWLPTFLVVYLAIVATVTVGWLVVPLATLLVFVLLSCLHFGLGDLGPDERRNGLAIAVRATTPLLPVLLVHPEGVTPLIGVLAGVPEASVSTALTNLHWLLVPWCIGVTCYGLKPISAWVRGRDVSGQVADASEVGAIAFAAVALPPLFAFALYFCLVHAVRHMVGIADEHAPRDARRALLLVAAVILPSAAVCLVVLALAWDGLGGVLGTTDVLAWSLRLVAALTVPHMALEAWAVRSSRADHPVRLSPKDAVCSQT